MTKAATKIPPTVAEYLTEQIKLCEKSQRVIAQEIDYEHSNVITMFKQGLTKVPINKVGPLARALGVDPIYFLKLVMNEYMPATWLAIENILGGEILTEREKKLLEAYRKAVGKLS